MNCALAIATSIAVGGGLLACGAPARPVSTSGAGRGSASEVRPDEVVLRDIRRDAARYLDCQVPMIDVALATWSGTQGNVVAQGCGFQVTYYVVCQASAQCGFTIAD